MEERNKAKHNKTWVGVLRAVLWVVVLLLWAVGASLLAAGSSSKAIAEGTNEALTGWGAGLMVVALILLVWNFVWGMQRWAGKWYARGWKTLGGIMRTIWGGVWRGVVFGAIGFFAMLVIVPMVETNITTSALAKVERAWLTGQVAIEEDFRRGNISPDEYLRYTMAVALGTEEAPERYRTTEAGMMPDISGMIDEYGEQLSRETLELALDVVLQTNIEVGLDVSGNVAEHKEDAVGKVLDAVLGTGQAQAYTKKATTLNKATLSGAGNFIVYYTDTGDDAISDEQAKNLAEMMERIVTSYKEKLGLEYSFTFHEWGKKNTKATAEVLSASGIDKEAYKTAMAVYVANPFSEETNTLAFYTGEHVAEWGTKVLMGLGQLMGVDEARWTESVVGVPNITILSSNVGDPSLELVTAHELGHHYQNLHCQAELGKMCPAGKFVSEGGANWLAVNVVVNQPEGNVVQGHHDVYARAGTCYRADTLISEPPKADACHNSGSFEGYPALAFLQNYYEAVDGATEKLMDALLTKEPLAYLREQATEAEFREVMRKLSQRNLTNAYAELALQTTEKIKGPDLDCAGKMRCSTELALRPTAVKYIYLATEEYDRVKVTVTGTANDVISVLGQKTGKWEVIADGVGKLEYTAEKTGEYEVVAFAVANASVTESGEFTVEAVVEEVEEIMDQEATAAAMGPEYVDGCMVLDFQGLMDDFLTIGKSTFELLEALGAETGDTAGEFEQGIAEAKREMSGKRLSICELKTKRGVSMGQVEQVVRRAMWLSYRVFTLRDEGAEMRILAGVDQTRRQGKVFLLGEESGTVYIWEIRLEIVGE